MWAARAAQALELPPHVVAFLRDHEAEEREHLRLFEQLLGTRALARPALPRVPQQWCTLAVHLYGYESLGLEFAALLAELRPDLAAILRDEAAHVRFYEREVRRILEGDDGGARLARRFAQAWWRRLPRTVERYLDADAFGPRRPALRRAILEAIERRFIETGLLEK